MPDYQLTKMQLCNFTSPEAVLRVKSREGEPRLCIHNIPMSRDVEFFSITRRGTCIQSSYAMYTVVTRNGYIRYEPKISENRKYIHETWKMEFINLYIK